MPVLCRVVRVACLEWLLMGDRENVLSVRSFNG